MGTNIFGSPMKIFKQSSRFLLAFAPTLCEKQNGPRHCLRSDAALTKLPLAEATWLHTRLNVLALKENTSALSNSPKQRERSLLMPRCTSHPITTLSKYALMTKRLSSLMLNPPSKCLLIWQIGQQEISTLYNAGDLSTVDSLAR